MSERIKKTLGAVQMVALIALVIFGMVTATVVSMPKAVNVPKNDPPPLVARHYLDVLGLSPDALAAAGLNAGQAGQIKANLEAHFEGNGAGLQAAIDAWGTAYRDADMARRAVQSSKGTVEELTAKEAALTSAAGSKQSAINAATAAALDQIDNAVVEKLARIKANRPQNVPVQYLLTVRTEEEWRQLRDALSHKRTREAAGRDVDTEATTIINNANAVPTAVEAAAGVTNNLAAILAVIAQ